MRLATAATIGAATLLSGCVPSAAPPPRAAAAVPPPAPAAAMLGLDSVMGSSARNLIARLGAPGLDSREGGARKLQFLGAACVLDAYLYPPREGRGEPVVTHVDARLPDGRDMDRASCLAALSRRD